MTKSLALTDGLIMQADGRKLRVRICDGLATLTFKGARHRLSREEVEVPLPLAQAQNLLDHHCDGRILSKTRHLVPIGALTWEIDIYDAPLDGIALAEIELPDESHPLVLPGWIGAEVTGDAAWRKISLLQARAAPR